MNKMQLSRDPQRKIHPSHPSFGFCFQSALFCILALICFPSSPRKEEGRDEPSLSGRGSRPREMMHLPRLSCFLAGVQAFIFGSKQIVQVASLTSPLIRFLCRPHVWGSGAAPSLDELRERPTNPAGKLSALSCCDLQPLPLGLGVVSVAWGW